MFSNKISLTISDAIALWGALLSTFLGIRAIYLSKIRLFISLDVSPNDQSKFRIIVANIGRRPVTIRSLDFYHSGSDDAIDYGYWGHSFIMAIQPHEYKKISVSGEYLPSFERAGKLRAEIVIAGRRRAKWVTVRK